MFLSQNSFIAIALISELSSNVFTSSFISAKNPISFTDFTSISALCAFIISCVLLCMLLSGCFQTVDVSSYDEAFVVMGMNSFAPDISEEDVARIKEIFQDKHLYRDNPSCGYGDNATIKFNNEASFFFFFDSCPTIYFENKDRYFDISEEEQKELYRIISKYIEFYDRDIIKDE